MNALSDVQLHTHIDYIQWTHTYTQWNTTHIHTFIQAAILAQIQFFVLLLLFHAYTHSYLCWNREWNMSQLSSQQFYFMVHEMSTGISTIHPNYSSQYCLLSRGLWWHIHIQHGIECQASAWEARSLCIGLQPNITPDLSEHNECCYNINIYMFQVKYVLESHVVDCSREIYDVMAKIKEVLTKQFCS